MPRRKSQALHNVLGQATQESLLKDSLRERPLVARDYSNGSALKRLRQQLAAVEEWGSRLTAAVPTRLMVAATLDSRAIADVFDDVAAGCHEAAPPSSRIGPSRDISVWKKRPVSATARADQLIHALTLLGVHVAGCWSWVPSRNPVSDDGAIDEDVAWELEYSPPPTSLREIIGSCGVLREATYQEDELLGRHFADALGIHNQVLRLAMSATEDLQQKAFADRVVRRASDVRAILDESDGNVVLVHDGLVSAVADIYVATQQTDGHLRGDWRRLHERLASRFNDWIDTVVPAMPIDRVRRQSFKRDMRNWVGYVAQYALLLRGNAASLELLRTVLYMKHLCDALGETLDSMQAVGPRSASVSRGVRMRCDRSIVSRDAERRWREQLGTTAAGVGRLIAAVVGAKGQHSAMPQRCLLKAAASAGLVTARATSSQKDQVEAVLVNMQLCGLAAKVPVAVFREETSDTPRTGPRRRIHAARDWWLNPLGTVLISRRV